MLTAFYKSPISQSTIPGSASSLQTFAASVAGQLVLELAPNWSRWAEAPAIRVIPTLTRNPSH